MIDCTKLEECFTEFTDRKKTLIDRKGGKSKLLIENPTEKKFKILDIENCIYRGLKDETKCDYGILDDKIFYFVELKVVMSIRGLNKFLKLLKV